MLFLKYSVGRDYSSRLESSDSLFCSSASLRNVLVKFDPHLCIIYSNYVTNLLVYGLADRPSFLAIF